MKSKITVFVVLMAFVIAGCGGTSRTSGSLSGTWKSDSPSMTAHVKNNTIEIDLVDSSTSVLYWKGTLPTTAADGSKIVSAGDTAAMEQSLFGSQDSSKQFTYKDGKLSFSFSILGQTRTVELEK